MSEGGVEILEIDDVEKRELHNVEENDPDHACYAIKLVCFVYLIMGIPLMVTYGWGVVHLLNKRNSGMELWGDLYYDTEWNWLLNIYYFSILCATVGYFPGLFHMISMAPHLPKNVLNWICGFYGAFYISSYFWMPLCVIYVFHPSDLLYWLNRLDLFISGVFIVLWAYGNLFMVPKEVAEKVNPALRIAGNLGVFAFAFHCAILDGLIWPSFFYPVRNNGDVAPPDPL